MARHLAMVLRADTAIIQTTEPSIAQVDLVAVAQDLTTPVLRAAVVVITVAAEAGTTPIVVGELVAVEAHTTPGPISRPRREPTTATVL